MMKHIFCSLALVASLCVSAAAAAQEQPKLPVDEDFDDWKVRCFNVKSMAPCDIYYALGNPETKQAIITISIAHFPSRNQNAINIRVPLGMSIVKGVVLEASAYKSQTIAFRRCNQNGCFVEGVLPAEVLNGLRRSGPNAKMKLTPYGAKEVELPFSLKGFSAAYAKMVEHAKSRATSQPANPASSEETAETPAPAPAP